MNTLETTPLTYVGTYCTVCGDGPMYRQGQIKDQGGVRIGAHGRCNKCDCRIRYRERRGMDGYGMSRAMAATMDSAGRAKHEATVAALRAYIDDRRRRGIPAEGTRSWLL